MQRPPKAECVRRPVASLNYWRDAELNKIKNSKQAYAVADLGGATPPPSAPRGIALWQYFKPKIVRRKLAKTTTFGKGREKIRDFFNILESISC